MVSINVTDWIGCGITLTFILGAGVIDILFAESETPWIIFMALVGLAGFVLLVSAILYPHVVLSRFSYAMGAGSMALGYAIMELGARVVVSQPEPMSLPQALLLFGVMAAITGGLAHYEQNLRAAHQKRREVESFAD